MDHALVTVVAAFVASLIPLALGIRHGQLTVAAVGAALAAGGVIQFGLLIGLAIAVGLGGVILVLPRRVLARRHNT